LADLRKIDNTITDICASSPCPDRPQQEEIWPDSEGVASPFILPPARAELVWSPACVNRPPLEHLKASTDEVFSVVSPPNCAWSVMGGDASPFVLLPLSPFLALPPASDYRPRLGGLKAAAYEALSADSPSNSSESRPPLESLEAVADEVFSIRLPPNPVAFPVLADLVASSIHDSLSSSSAAAALGSADIAALFSLCLACHRQLLPLARLILSLSSLLDRPHCCLLHRRARLAARDRDSSLWPLLSFATPPSSASPMFLAQSSPAPLCSLPMTPSSAPYKPFVNYVVAVGA
jgi:hypothetical protein